MSEDASSPADRPRAPASAGELPESLGPYRILGRLGAGGMGEVYRAHDGRLERPVALKLIRPDGLGSAEARARFRREARTAAALRHPAIVQVYDILEWDGGECIVMELVEGETLTAALRAGPLPLPRVLGLGREIAGGLAEAHARSIVHRDLKTDNVLVTPAGRASAGRASAGHAKILDFGLAKRLSATESSLSAGGKIVGTFHAMSPEQAQGGEVDHRTDLFSLGVLLYHCLTGTPPFRGDTPSEILARICMHRPPPASTLDRRIPEPLSRLVDRLLEKDPDRRVQSAAEVAATLAGIAGRPADAPPEAAPDSVREAARTPTVEAEPRSAAAGGQAVARRRTAVRTLLAGELTGALGFAEALGEAGAAELLRRHDRLVIDLAAAHRGREVDRGEGFLLLFERPVHAVLFALAYHRDLGELSAELGRELTARAAIHLGEVTVEESPPEDVARGARPLAVEGLARLTVTRLRSLARQGQTLMTRAGFDLARRAALGTAGEEVRWLAHGKYSIAGMKEPLEIFEVGGERRAPLTPPPDSELARRGLDQPTLAGWRPASGLAVPQRPHWIVERRLGSGGFGEVWLAAHRKTGDRRVFKFCYDAASLKTLQREITLFRLLKEELGERPDIVRILDWSFDEAPYFIESEYRAEGTLVDWAAAHGGLARIPLATRLEIVAQVATALAAAHSIGVLHKDVKPSNVLVARREDGEPRAQLGDFGIGRVTERERLRAAGITALGLTETADPDEASDTGTRLYMAPELLEGRPATLKTDTYALGVVLYQMVAGDFGRALAPGWRRDVGDELLAGDVAAAVDGAPERRLGDAGLLAERLRGLEERRRRRDAEARERREAERLRTSLERLRRRRRWLAAAAGLALAVSTVVGALAVRASREARRANREAAAAQRVSDFMVDLFEVSDPFDASPPGEVRGETVTAREILDRGAERLDRELAAQPEIRARLVHTVGRVYASLGLYGAARPLLERALELRRELFGGSHPEVAESESTLAELLGAVADYDAAEPLYRQALATYRRHAPEDAAAARCLRGLGTLAKARGDYDAAEPFYREALALYRRLEGPESLEIATSANDLAVLLGSRGDFDGAEPLYREALDIRRGLLGDDHPSLATSLNNLAVLLVRRGDYDDAEPLYREALDKYRPRLGDRHPLVATLLDNLATLLTYRGSFADAEALYREALDIRRRLWNGSHPELASTLNHLATLLHNRGDYRSAEALHEEALAMHRELLGDEHPEVAADLANLASLYRTLGDFEKAEPLVREALAIRRRTLDERHPHVADSVSDLALVRESLGDFEEAEGLYRESVAMRRRLGEHPDLATNLTRLARLLSSRGNDAEAEPLFREALDLRRRLLGDEHNYVAQSLADVALVLQNRGELDEALELQREALAIYRSLLGDDHPNVAVGRANLARVHTLRGEYETAEALYEEALSGVRRLLGEEHLYAAIISRHRAVLRLASGHAEAEDDVREALRLFDRALPEGHWRRADAESVLGAVLARAGRFADAERLLVASYPAIREQAGEHAPAAVEARQRLVDFYESRGRPEKAAVYRGGE